MKNTKDYLTTLEVVSLANKAIKNNKDSTLKPFDKSKESNKRRMEYILKKGKVGLNPNSKKPLLWKKDDVEQYFLAKEGLDLRLNEEYHKFIADIRINDQKSNEEVYNSNDDVPRITPDIYASVELRLLLKLVAENLGRNFDTKALQEDLELVFISTNRDFENFRALRSLEKLDINRYFPKKDKK